MQQGTATKHYQCALLQADGRRDLENDQNPGDDSDLFGFTPGVALSNTSNPNTREWDGRDSELLISEISESAREIKFRVGRTGTPPASFHGRQEANLEIPDNSTGGITGTIQVPTVGITSRVRVALSIKHSFVGDLVVELVSPSGRRAFLRLQQGGSQVDLDETVDSNDGRLGPVLGQPSQGSWQLRVSDRAQQDTGRLVSWALDLETASS